MKKSLLIFLFILLLTTGCEKQKAAIGVDETSNLPVISITDINTIYKWQKLEPGMLSNKDIIAKKADWGAGTVYQLTPPELWHNQKMQLFGLGYGASEYGLGIYCLYLTDDEKIVHFVDKSGLLGYMINQVYLADLNNDGIYEIYTNSVAGSGVSHNFVQAYEPATNTFSELNKRMETNYSFFVNNGQLYLVVQPFAKETSDAAVYKPVLSDGMLSYTKIRSYTGQVVDKTRAALRYRLYFVRINH